MDEDKINERIVRMYQWYVEKKIINDEVKFQLHGIVTGHGYLMDSIFTDTTEIMDITSNIATKELVITTKNTVYHCNFNSCDLKQQKNIIL